MKIIPSHVQPRRLYFYGNFHTQSHGKNTYLYRFLWCWYQRMMLFVCDWLGFRKLLQLILRRSRFWCFIRRSKCVQSEPNRVSVPQLCSIIWLVEIKCVPVPVPVVAWMSFYTSESVLIVPTVINRSCIHEWIKIRLNWWKISKYLVSNSVGG
jgi:hypothetical protein